MHILHTKSRMFISIILLIFCSCPIWGIRSSAMAGEQGKSPGTKCDIHKTACTGTLQDYTVTLDIEPKPVKAMTDLTFTVTLSDNAPSANPFIDLGMPGMDMGPNRVKLVSTGNRTYSGKGIIVRCPSGRRTWKAAVTIPDVGTEEFVFDVIY